MSNADTHSSQIRAAQNQAGAGETESEVDAKQGTDAPKGMPVVLIVSTVGAAVAMFVVWTVFFA